MENEEKLLKMLDAEITPAAEDLSEQTGLSLDVAELVLHVYSYGLNKYWYKYYQEANKSRELKDLLGEVSLMALRKICEK